MVKKETKKEVATTVKKEMTTEEIRYRLNQLRQDKIIYAVESVALSMAGFLVYGSLDLVIYLYPALQNSLTVIASVAVLLPVAFLVFMILGNMLRCVRITWLERLLKAKQK